MSIKRKLFEHGFFYSEQDQMNPNEFGSMNLWPREKYKKIYILPKKDHEKAINNK